MAKRVKGRGVSEACRKLDELPVSDLPVVFASWLKLPATTGEEVFSAVRTFWLFVSQVLSPDPACEGAVAKAIRWVLSEGGKEISSNTSAYCQARSRLSLEWLHRIVEKLVCRLRSKGKHLLWYGRDVVVVDGTGVSMPDTNENRKRWTQPGRQANGCGFPVLKIVTMFSLASGALLACATGTLTDSERTLWRTLWRKLQRGTVVLSDKGFGSFGEFYFLMLDGVDCVARYNDARRWDVREVKSLGKGDRLVEWQRSKACPNWIASHVWKSMPCTMILREITSSISRVGYRTKQVVLVTTLLDNEQFPTHAFGELYLRRWCAELWLRDLKISMGMDVLRCKTPSMIERELLMYWIGYNLVRALMLDAALANKCDPTRMSFKMTVRLIHQWCIFTARATTRNEQTRMLNLLLSYLTRRKLCRRNRPLQPRAVKRRPKNYQRLTAPRHEFVEIKHRNRAKKLQA
jgi:Transposase DDE domain